MKQLWHTLRRENVGLFLLHFSSLAVNEFKSGATLQLIYVFLINSWLLQAFTQIDAIGSKGVLRRRELRDLLFKMVIPMGPEEFKRLWTL